MSIFALTRFNTEMRFLVDLSKNRGMVAFCKAVIREIKGASNDVEIREILSRSLKDRNDTRGGPNHSMLILNLIVSIRAALAEKPDQHTLSMLLFAMAELREYQKNNLNPKF